MSTRRKTASTASFYETPRRSPIWAGGGTASPSCAYHPPPRSGRAAHSPAADCPLPKAAPTGTSQDRQLYGLAFHLKECEGVVEVAHPCVGSSPRDDGLGLFRRRCLQAVRHDGNHTVLQETRVVGFGTPGVTASSVDGDDLHGDPARAKGASSVPGPRPSRSGLTLYALTPSREGLSNRRTSEAGPAAAWADPVSGFRANCRRSATLPCSAETGTVYYSVR